MTQDYYIAIGFLTPQPILLMDEPFDGFDLRQTRDMMGVLRRVTSGGRTLLLSIHQLRDAEQVCDRFVLLSGGQICGVGTLDELRAANRTLGRTSGGSLFLALTSDLVPTRKTRLSPLLTKELREIVSGRALWTLLLLECPLVGYSFFQALSLYGEASTTAARSPALATGLSPLDSILVPTFGTLYVAVTLLFPFVAIRTLGEEKQSGALSDF